MVSKLNKLIKTYHSPECEFNIDKSIEICEEILNINPKLIEYQSHLAYSYYQKSEYTKTIQLFTDYIENGGEKDISYYMIALSYFKLNEMERGRSSLAGSLQAMCRQLQIGVAPELLWEQFGKKQSKAETN